MSRSKQPTIPFVLPLYEKMNMHILTTVNNKNAHLKIRQSARSAQEKLLKYKVKADTNQFYTIATGMQRALADSKSSPLIPPA